MPDIEIDIQNNPPVEIELENASLQAPEVDLDNLQTFLDEIETFPLYGPRGPKGEKGDKGEKGEKGEPGGSQNYIHEQTVASATWIINHNLNKLNIRAVIIDSSGTVFYPPVVIENENTCRIELIGATTGTAYIN